METRFKSWAAKVFKSVGVILLAGFALSFLFSTSSLTEHHLLYNKREQSTYLYTMHDDELLPSRFDEVSCRSRYEYDNLLHGRRPSRKPSHYLVSKLRSYEERHRKCSPYTDFYNKTVAIIHSNKSITPTECKYNIWFPTGGLGNRMISLASAYLYALLTDRVLLVDPEDAISDLFCEPFPGGSWLLPSDFPLRDRFKGFRKHSQDSFGELLRKNVLGDAGGSTLPPYVYAHVYSDYGDLDKRFYCDKEQSYVKDVPWTIMMSNEYFAPAFFMMPSFREELHKLFPDKGTVFHFLSRYLFHPTDSVWELVTRFYEAYLSTADVKVGIQIRIFHREEGIPSDKVLDQVLSCTVTEGLLPNASNKEEKSLSKAMGEHKIAVMLASLSRYYFTQMRKLYWENGTLTGEDISIHQPSFEGHQHTGDLNHDRKALAEMYLLSLTDKLVTSASSTFGYVAQGLGGLTPWMVFKPKNETENAPSCHRLLSMDPCFHMPPSYDCEARHATATSLVEPYLRQCEDVSRGVKLVQP